MQELEKILEEIEKQKSCCLMIGYAKKYNQGALKMAEVIEDIIRKHMDNNNLCEKCSRRKWYQIGYKDGKNDGWIPVTKYGLPNENEDDFRFWITIQYDNGYKRTIKAKWNYYNKCFTYENGRKISQSIIAYKYYSAPEPYKPKEGK